MLQIVSSLKIIRDRIVAALVQLAQLATQYAALPIVGAHSQRRGADHHRSASLPRQTSCYWRNSGLRSYSPAIRYVASRVRLVPARTCSICWVATGAAQAPERVADSPAWSVLVSTGQVFRACYPRRRHAAGPGTRFLQLATSIRLDTGMSWSPRASNCRNYAMPRRNPRSCGESPWLAVIISVLSMIAELRSDQWNEAHALPAVFVEPAAFDAFFALDGLFETFLTVLADFGAFPAVINASCSATCPSWPRARC